MVILRPTKPPGRPRYSLRPLIRRVCLTLLISVSCCLRIVRGDADDDTPVGGMPNVPSQTLGGQQWWGDEMCFHGWRVQRHVLTGHCRLLDDANRRRAWGTYEYCQARLIDMRDKQGLPPMQGKVVILLHGMFRTRASMHKMADFLESHGDYSVLRVSYPSTRASLDEHARALATIMAGLGPQVTEIDLVAHSLGNLVTRRYYHQQSADDAEGADPRIHRIVMLGPPNHPPARARRFADDAMLGGLYQLVLPETGSDLAYGYPWAEGKLATPACEFGIVAGGKGDGRGYRTSLPGDNDGTVTILETRLPGATDFVALPVRHTFMMNDAQVQRYVLSFLNNGYFVAADRRQAIPAETASRTK
jgi:hypothetical protein